MTRQTIVQSLVPQVYDDLLVAEADIDAIEADQALRDARPVFTATKSFSYRHNIGVKPNVTVHDSSGSEIVACVRHPNDQTVSISFVGTLTNAVLNFS